jgi:hypothetical protein
MQLNLTHVQRQAIVALRTALPDTRLVLIGATALNAHVDLDRVTRDIDLALVAHPATSTTCSRHWGGHAIHGCGRAGCTRVMSWPTSCRPRRS